ncbi:MAG TPA: hypothetical protein VKE98_05215 [Gemmataceae bacterium]|nr:hypothetical protein [Gemmataceae bacterium]
MNLIVTPLVLLSLLAQEGKPAPKFPLGKESTYVTGPLDKEGYVDYEAALNDRLGKGITPQKNANVLLWKALGPTPEGGRGMPAEFFKRLGIKEPAAKGDYLIGIGQFIRDRLKLDRNDMEWVFEQHDWAGQRPWTAREYPHIAAWLKANEKPLAVVVEATKRPDYFSPLVSRWNDKDQSMLIGALLPGVQKCRELAYALTARAMLRAGEGKFDEAWQDLLACHRLGRLVGRGATLIEALVGIAIDQIASNSDLAYLERANLTAKQAQERLKDLRELPAMTPLADRIDLAERFMYLDSLQMLRRRGLSCLDGLMKFDLRAQPKADKNELKAMARIDWAPAFRSGNRWYDRLAAAMRHKDRAARDKALDKIEFDLKNLKKQAVDPAILAKLIEGKEQPDKMVSKAIGDVLVSLLMPATRKVQNAFDRTEQVQGNLQVAFALAGYHREHGRYPAKLEDLAPKYVAAVPKDFFSGKALVYRPAKKGYLFYSVGVNGKDEGGRSYDDDPPGDDLRVRMPLPALKGKKAGADR